MHRFLFNLRIALESLISNKVRTLLTALGIIFGVSSVIAMLAIGKGAQEEILNQIKLVGINNIVIEQKAFKPAKKNSNTNQNTKNDKKNSSWGLTIADGESLLKLIPGITKISPEISYDIFAIRPGIGHSADFKGVNSDYFAMLNMAMAHGRTFNQWELTNGAPVCIIGGAIDSIFFKGKNPIGQQIKCGRIWLQIIGVLQGRRVSKDPKDSIGFADNNQGIYAPIETVLLRYKDRSSLSETTIRLAQANSKNNEDDDDESSQGATTTAYAYNQIDKLIVQVSSSKYINSVANVSRTMLTRRHNNVQDFTITIPEDLLRHEQQTKDIFNLVLAVIAGISLLVGGIGIMNIMLVSVMERLREIGLRMALGATKNDVIMQFLAEAILISVAGGLAGVILGITLSLSISYYFHILTIISFSSILLSFLVAAAIGLIFGIAPARKAAMQDPIESLRHE